MLVVGVWTGLLVVLALAALVGFGVVLCYCGAGLVSCGFSSGANGVVHILVVFLSVVLF